MSGDVVFFFLETLVCTVEVDSFEIEPFTRHGKKQCPETLKTKRI
jgi:hypothetical protein